MKTSVNITASLAIVLALAGLALLLYSRPRQSEEDRQRVQSLIHDLDAVNQRLASGVREGVAEELRNINARIAAVSVLTPEDERQIQQRLDKGRELNKKIYAETKRIIEEHYP